MRFYDGADGLKTGLTDNAGSCIAATAKRNNLRLIMIGLGYKKSSIRNTEAMSLLDYGFNQYEAELLFKKGDVVGSKKLEKASESKLNVMVKKDVSIIKKKTNEKEEYKYDLEIDNINPPIKKGDEVGMLYVKEKNKIRLRVPVVATKDISKINILKLYFKIVKDIISGNA